LGRPLNKITVLDVVEAIDGPMDTPLGLEEHAARDRFAINASKAYDKAVAQGRSVLRKVKISELI
jgi:DNA-binding IscR family transcriptional regulator